MTEAEWLASDDPEEMYSQVVKPGRNSRRRLDLFCLACAHLVFHLIEDQGARRAFEWLEENPGQRHRPETNGHVRDRFQGPARALYEAHHRRERSIGGRAVHVAYDLWAGWYEYAFPNLLDLFTHYPEALRDDPRASLPAIMRDIFGDPFRPVAFSPEWRTSTAVLLARGIYKERAFDRMPILADALQDAGCDSDDILSHCRGPGPHVRGCWVVDLVLGKE